MLYIQPSGVSHPFSFRCIAHPQANGLFNGTFRFGFGDFFGHTVIRATFQVVLFLEDLIKERLLLYEQFPLNSDEREGFDRPYLVNVSRK